MTAARLLILAATVEAMMLYATAAAAADAARGRQLAEAKCMECHDNAIYQVPARKANDLAAVVKQIRQGEQALGLGWTEKDVADVAAYLNQRFYKLPR